MVRLEDWWLATERWDGYKAPELLRMCLKGTVSGHPRKQDGTTIGTTPIVAGSGRRARTESGTVYELGRPNVEWLAWLADSGYAAVDPDRPLARMKGLPPLDTP